MVGPSQEPRIGDEVIGVDDAQEGTSAACARAWTLNTPFCQRWSGQFDEDILHYYPLAKTQQKRPSGLVVVGRRPCEPLNNPTLLSLGEGSHLKRESHPSPIGLDF
jgi:hypothetical protein